MPKQQQMQALRVRLLEMIRRNEAERKAHAK